MDTFLCNFGLAVVDRGFTVFRELFKKFLVMAMSKHVRKISWQGKTRVPDKRPKRPKFLALALKLSFVVGIILRGDEWFDFVSSLQDLLYNAIILEISPS